MPINIFIDIWYVNVLLAELTTRLVYKLSIYIYYLYYYGAAPAYLRATCPLDDAHNSRTLLGAPQIFINKKLLNEWHEPRAVYGV